MDIDLVVPWVDGNDIEHIKSKNKYKALLGDKVVSEAVIDARHRDNSELKYLLRSIEQNAKFIRYVFLVTDGQIPKWLNTNHSKIKLVTHSQIMPQSALPNFNASAIESCIANIPGLSDSFLYANDDFYILKPISENFFFDKNGYPISRLKPNYHPEKKAIECYDTLLEFATELFYSKFNKKMHFFEHHNIDAFYKPDVLKCIEIFKNEFDTVIHCKFRQPYTVSKMIWTFYSLYVGHARLKNNWIHKIPKSLRCISKILFNIYGDSKLIGYDVQKYRLPRNIKLFCLNDTGNVNENDIKRGIAFLNDLFPNKSSFEI